jgi:hypothetical protein
VIVLSRWPAGSGKVNGSVGQQPVANGRVMRTDQENLQRTKDGAREMYNRGK